MNPIVMKIKCCRENKEQWKNHPTYVNAKLNHDSGLDIPMPETVVVPPRARGFPLYLGVKVEPSGPFMTMPRSSISKTPLRLSNSIGLIDISYRGELISKVDNMEDEPFTVEQGKCYFQMVTFNGILPEIELVDELGSTLRGEGGFGSTTSTSNVCAFQPACSSKESCPCSCASVPDSCGY